MTVSTSTNKAFFTADGTTGTFYFTYRLLRAADLQVYIAQVLVDPGQYSVTINTDGVGGNVLFTTPPGTLLLPVRGLIYRHVDYTQETHLPTESDFDQKSVENALDKLTMEVQQLQEEISRAATLSLFDESGVTIQLPPPSSRRALLWHPAEDGRLINSTYDPDTLFTSASALLATMAADLAAAQAAASAAAASAATASIAAGTSTTASGNYNRYFPGLNGAPTGAKGDMLVFYELAPGQDAFATIAAGSNGQVLQANSAVQKGIEWVTPTPIPTDDAVFNLVASFLQEGSNVTLFKDYSAKTITVNATGPSPVPPPPPPGVITDSRTITFTKRSGSGWDSSPIFPNPPGTGGTTNNDTTITYSSGGAHNTFFFSSSTVDSVSPGVTYALYENHGDVSIYNIAGASTGATIVVTFNYQYTP